MFFFVFCIPALPFDNASIPAIFERIARADYAFPDWLSVMAMDVLEKMLCLDPNQRIEADYVLAHPWMQLSLDDEPAPPPASPVARLTSGASGVEVVESPALSAALEPALGSKQGAFDMIHAAGESALHRLYHA
jgi:hypothetical protein